jgi:hypothetical protein
MAYLFGAHRWWRQHPAAVRPGWRGGVEAAWTQCLHRQWRGKGCGAFAAVVVDEALATLRRRPGSGVGKGVTGETMGRSPQPQPLGHEPGSSRWGSRRICRSWWGGRDGEVAAFAVRDGAAMIRRGGAEARLERTMMVIGSGYLPWLTSFLLSVIHLLLICRIFERTRRTTKASPPVSFTSAMLSYCLFSFAPFHLHVYMLFLSFTFVSRILFYSLFLFAPFHLLLLR